MKRRNVIIGLSALVVALTVLVFAGEFYGNGSVDPTIGWANETEFLYEIQYALAPEQSPPNVYVKLYKDNEFHSEHMMAIVYIGSILVDYEYETTLSEGDWGFKFETLDDETLTYVGPSVFEH